MLLKYRIDKKNKKAIKNTPKSYSEDALRHYNTGNRNQKDQEEEKEDY